MGQAKQRGTFEERRAEAMAREEAQAQSKAQRAQSEAQQAQVRPTSFRRNSKAAQMLAIAAFGLAAGLGDSGKIGGGK